MPDERTLDRARIDELEARVAQQDQSIIELSDELYRQQRQVAQLEERLRQLTERFKSVAGGEPAPRPEDEKPPHY